MLTLADDTERRSFLRGRLVGRVVDYVEWISDGLLCRLSDAPLYERGQMRVAGFSELAHSGFGWTQLVDEPRKCGADVFRSVCHTTSSVGCD